MPSTRLILGIGFSHSPHIKNPFGKPIGNAPSIIGVSRVDEKGDNS